MKVEVKNLLYHPISFLINGGVQVQIQARSKMVFSKDVLLDSTMSSLVKKEFIKIKKI